MRISSTYIEHALNDIFPADKNVIIEFVHKNNGSNELIAYLRKLPDRTYRDIADVNWNFKDFLDLPDRSRVNSLIEGINFELGVREGDKEGRSDADGGNWNPPEKPTQCLGFSWGYYCGYYDGFSTRQNEIFKSTDPTASEILYAHNKYRKEVGTKPLYYDVQLVPGAQQWAQQLNNTYHDGTIVHSQEALNGIYGESIGWSSNTNESWTNVIDFLASEKKCFQNNYYPDIYNKSHLCDYISTTCRDKQDCNCAVHYSQIIWSGTQKVGAAHVGNYWVFRYDPPGNVTGYKAY